MTREPYSIRTCSSYRGPEQVCRAGVDVETTRDADGRVACCVIRGITSAIECAAATIPEPPADQELGTLSKGLHALLADRCPTCGEEMRGELQFENGAVLAMPCECPIRDAPQQRRQKPQQG